MNPKKSPGPDSFPPMFYQKFWHILEHQCIDLILSFFHNHILPPTLNHTLITLIPKTQPPEMPKDFRPINLFNVLYKIITKILAN